MPGKAAAVAFLQGRTLDLHSVVAIGVRLPPPLRQHAEDALHVGAGHLGGDGNGVKWQPMLRKETLLALSGFSEDDDHADLAAVALIDADITRHQHRTGLCQRDDREQSGQRGPPMRTPFSDAAVSTNGALHTTRSSGAQSATVCAMGPPVSRTSEF